MPWGLSSGDVILRRDLHAEYGGQQQGGISTPRSSPNIIIFADPTTGHQHGYLDEWVTEELHYCGEGQPQHGDQKMAGGNLAILHHKDTARSIRAFYGSKGSVTYAGEFALADDDEPSWYLIDVPNPHGGTRKVIRFRLVPVGTLQQVEPTHTHPIIVPPAPLSEDYKPAVATPTESRTPFAVDPDAIDRGLAGHVNTQNALQSLATANGCCTHSPGAADPNFDLAWRRPDGSAVVVEVKSLTSSNELGQIRLGLGQVLDYAHQLRETEPNLTAVLVLEAEPVAPRWVDVCATYGVILVWPATFETLF